MMSSETIKAVTFQREFEAMREARLRFGVWSEPTEWVVTVTRKSKSQVKQPRA